MGRRIGLIALVLASAILVSACGGSDNGDGDRAGSTLPQELTTSSAPDTLTKDEYITRGDQICAAGTFRIGDQARQQFPSGQLTAEQIRSFTQQTVVPVFEDQINQLRALPPPSGDAPTVEAIYDALQNGISQLKANPVLFSQPNAGGIFDEASRLARSYGFKQCGQR